MSSTIIEIAKTWDGMPAEGGERVVLDLTLEGEVLEIRLEAPYHGDPRPPEPAGSRDGLWEWEVVELFLLGEQERYLEIELGPHGHYLLLQLQGARQPVETGMTIDYRAEIDGRRWRGRAKIPLELLPRPILAGNAYAIHGAGKARRHLASFPVHGSQPDFHRLEAFRPLGLE